MSKWEAGSVVPGPEMQAALDTALRRCDAETRCRFTDEAAAVTLRALGSGRVVPSNRWRADEIVTGMERLGTTDAPALRDALETYCPGRRSR